MLKKIETCIAESEYYQIYDLIEFLVVIIVDQNFSRCVNLLFEEELVGYRIIDKTIVPITNQIEIDSIEASINTCPYS
ncbi:MAG: AbiJ-NTD4 domain-containing protein [Patescibacteria group bacterium]